MPGHRLYVPTLEPFDSAHPFLQQAVGIAGVSRSLCSSSEVELANHNEAVDDASQSKRKWSSKFLHSMSPIAGSAWFSKGWCHPS